MTDDIAPITFGNQEDEDVAPVTFGSTLEDSAPVGFGGVTSEAESSRSIAQKAWGYFEGAVLSAGQLAAFPITGTIAAGKGAAAATAFGDVKEYVPEFDKTYETAMDMTQATTPEGLKVQAAVGDAFHYVLSATQTQLDKVRQPAQDALVGIHQDNPNFEIAQLGSHIDTALNAEALLALVPFLGPRAYKGYTKYRDMKEIDRIMKPINERRAKEKELRENKDLPYELTSEETGRLNGTFKDNAKVDATNDYSAFAAIYLEANKDASRAEITKAWQDYKNTQMRDAYRGISANLEIINSKARERPIQATSKRLSEEEFINSRLPPLSEVPTKQEKQAHKEKRNELQKYYREQYGSNKVPVMTKEDYARRQQDAEAGIVEPKAVEGIEWTPVTMTRQEFALAKVKETADPRAAYNAKSKKPTDKGFKQYLRNLEKKVDKLYKEYLGTRMWPQWTPVPTQKDIVTRAFELREQEAAGLRMWQEQHGWAQLEKDTGLDRGRFLISSILNENPIPADKLQAATRLSTPRELIPEVSADKGLYGSRSVISSVDTILRNAEEALNDSIDVLRLQGKLEPDIAPAPRKFELKPEQFRDVFEASKNEKQFETNLTAKYGDTYKPFAKYIAAELRKAGKGGPKTPSGEIKENGRIRATGKQRSLVQSVIELAGGKSISMLWDAAQNSPSLQAALDLIWRPELHRSTGVAVSNIVHGRRIEQGRYFHELSSIYIQLQRELGKVWFTGFKNISPGFMKGWAGRSLPKRYNDELFLAMNGKAKSNTSQAILNATKNIRALYDKMYNYAKAAGLDVEYIENYGTRRWNFDAIRKNEEGFKNILRKAAVDEATIDRLVLELITYEGLTPIPIKDSKIRYLREQSPNFRHQVLAKNAELQRKLHNIPLEEAMEFLDTNVHHVLTKYITDVVNRAEFAKRFGPDEGKLHEYLLKAHEELKQNRGEGFRNQELMRLFDIIDTLQGAYKVIGSRAWRNVINTTISGTNFLLLQWATVASLPEIFMPLYHGGVRAWVKAMPTAVASGTKEFVRNWIYKDLPKSQREIFAESISKAGELMTLERIEAMYSGNKITALDAFTFNANLLTGWNKFMNYLAIDTFQNLVKDYLKTKASGKNYYSTRYTDSQMDSLMKYLGMDTAEGIKWYKEGMKVDDPFYEKWKLGAITFAEDSVLTSNPAIRPMWHSNPNLALLSHLKGFPTMFGNTVVKRWAWDLAQIQKGAGGVTRNGTYVLSTGMLMLMVAMLSVMARDLGKFGGPNPGVPEDEYMQWAFLRAFDTVGFGGGAGILGDAFFNANRFDPIVSMIGPSASIAQKSIINASNAAKGAVSSEKPTARHIAKQMALFTSPIYNNMYVGSVNAAMGADAPLTKETVTDFYEEILISLGFDKGPSSGLSGLSK